MFDQRGSQVALQRQSSAVASSGRPSRSISEEAISSQAQALGYAFARGQNTAELEQSLKQTIARSGLPKAKSQELINIAQAQGRSLWVDANRSASELYRASNGIGTDEAKVRANLQGKTPEEINRIRDAYRSRYNQDLDRDLQGEYHTSAGKREISALLAGSNSPDPNRVGGQRLATSPAKPSRQGSAPTQDFSPDRESDRLRIAMQGVGTDENAIKAVLRNRTQAQISEIRMSYNARYHRDLDADIRGELSGEDLFDAQLALRGRPANQAEALQLAEDRHRHERSGSFSWVVDRFSKEGAVMDRELAAMRDAYQRFQTSGDPRYASQVDLGSELLTISADGFREDKHRVAKNVATGVAVGSSLALLPAFGIGVAALASKGIAVWGGAQYVAAGAVGFSARRVVGSSILGHGESSGAIAQDTLAGVIDGVTLGVGNVVGGIVREKIATAALTAVQKKVLAHTLSGIADGGTGGTIDGGLNAATQYDWRTGDISGGVRSVLAGAAIGGGIGALGGAITGGGTQQAKPSTAPLKESVDRLKIPPRPVVAANSSAPQIDWIPNQGISAAARSKPHQPGPLPSDFTFQPHRAELVPVRSDWADGMYRSALQNGDRFNLPVVNQSGITVTTIPVFGMRKEEEAAVLQLLPVLSKHLGKGQQTPLGGVKRVVVVDHLTPPHSRALFFHPQSVDGQPFQHSNTLFINRRALSDLAALDRRMGRFGPPVHTPEVSPPVKPVTPIMPATPEVVSPINPGRWNRTQIARARADAAGKLVPSESAPNGLFNGRPIIGHDLPVNGGVYLSGSSRNPILVEPTSRLLSAAYSHLRAQIKTGDSEERILERVFDFVSSEMKYWNKEGISVDEFVLKKRQRSDPSADKNTPLAIDEFIAIKSGVCAHQALFAASLLESLKKEGIIRGAISMDRNEVPLLGAHAWVRYTPEGGEPVILDIAKSFFGRLSNTARNWWYERPGEQIRQMAGR